MSSRFPVKPNDKKDRIEAKHTDTYSAYALLYVQQKKPHTQQKRESTEDTALRRVLMISGFVLNLKNT